MNWGETAALQMVGELRRVITKTCLITKAYALFSEKAMASHSYSCLENPMDGGAW